MIPLLHLTFLGEKQYGLTSHPSSEVDIRVFLKGFWFSVFLIGPSFAEYGHMVEKTPCWMANYAEGRTECSDYCDLIPHNHFYKFRSRHYFTLRSAGVNKQNGISQRQCYA